MIRIDLPVLSDAVGTPAARIPVEETLQVNLKEIDKSFLQFPEHTCEGHPLHIFQQDRRSLADALKQKLHF